MAESVVSSVVERVGDLLISEAKFLYGVRDQVEQVRTELRRMQCFLKDADARQHESETIKNWVEEIREIAYDVEDILLIFTFKVASRRRRRSGRIRNILLRFACILNECIALHKVGSEIESIKNKISSLTTSLQTYGIRAITLGEGYQRQLELRRSYSHVVQEDFVGLGGDVKTMVAKLVNEDENCRVVSICGMGGLGKTTLAEKVYHHSDVRRHFDSFAWFCISQQWQSIDVLKGLLTKLIPNEREQIKEMIDDELVKRLYDVQLQKKCLVVLDDIWSTDACDSLSPAFPNRESGSKILLTSRNKDVALHIDPNVYLHEPKCLNQEESWELLQKKAFLRRHGPDYNKIDTEMEKVGKEMIGRCGGLPLAIILLGGILATKPYTSSEWEMVNQNLNWYLSNCKGQRGVSEVLGFSYHDLPYQFKQCFLYLGNFPEDKEINARNLYQQWVAEGIVSSSEERGREETMMDVAERYLSELAQRCMVRVSLRKVWSSKTGGRFKSCRLHDLMRDLCLSKVKDENFLSIIDFGHGNEDSLCFSSSRRKIRRLAIYRPPDEHLPLGKGKAQAQAQAQHVRSLLIFNERSSLKLVKMITNFEDYKLLRVLNLEGFGKNIELPEAIGKLIHLRYLSLRHSGFSKLPSSTGNLGYLQTLDLRVRCDPADLSAVRIPNVLWKMEQLRHLYLPFYSNSKLRLDGLSNLETLTNFNTSNCDVKDLLKLTNLRKLKAIIDSKEQLGDFVTMMIPMKNRLRCSSLDFLSCSFCSEEELTLLRRALGCHHLYKLYINGEIRRALPEYHQFSPSLTKLALCNSELKEDPMPTLEKLPSLRWLELYQDSFVGDEMVCSAMGFPQLTSLQLWILPNLDKWRVDEGAFPNLMSLQILNCQKLRMVPDGCRFITTLQQLVIADMPESFENRLRVVDGEEGQDFYKVRHVPNIKFNSWFSCKAILGARYGFRLP